VSDQIVSTHRGHHHVLAKGASPDRLMAELLGRAAGYSRGRGGSMHVAIPELGIVGTNGIVGGGLPIAMGTAYAQSISDGDGVTVCFFGEGAAATGAFGEALNLAGLWKLPVVFVCENNQYVELTPASLHVAGGAIWKRASGYGIPGEAVDGNDVREMASAARTAIARARAGGGPTLIEAMTYRWLGHYAGDRAAYRDEAELEEARARDPLLALRTELDEGSAAQIEADVASELAEALTWALASAPATTDGIGLDHYATVNDG